MPRRRRGRAARAEVRRALIAGVNGGVSAEVSGASRSTFRARTQIQGGKEGEEGGRTGCA